VFYSRVLWPDRKIVGHTNVLRKISHVNRIHISDTSTNGPRMMVCYFHFQIHTAHMQTFHNRARSVRFILLNIIFLFSLEILARESEASYDTCLYEVCFFVLFHETRI